MWFFHYYSFKLLHKNYTLLSLKPPLSNLTFVYFFEVVSLHLHMLPQHYQSHLYLESLFASHLRHLPHILPWVPTKFLNLIIISGIMFLLIQLPMILKCIPYITWLEFLEDHEQFLVILSSIVCPAIAKPFETLSPSYMILVFLWCIALQLSSSLLYLALICTSSSHTSLVFS